MKGISARQIYPTAQIRKGISKLGCNYLEKDHRAKVENVELGMNMTTALHCKKGK